MLKMCLLKRNLPTSSAKTGLEPIVSWYTLVLLAGLLCTAVFVVTMTTAGFSARKMLLVTAHGESLSLVQATRWDYDSWGPLLQAFKRTSMDPPTSPYGVFFEGQAKFQYPPSALFLAELLPADVVDEALHQWEGSRLQQWNRWVGSVALLAT